MKPVQKMFCTIVALKPGDGIKWLAYELAVPFAVILVMSVMIPVLHKKNHMFSRTVTPAAVA
jgi:hypothetical protein